MTAPKFTPGPWGSVIASWGDNGVCFEIEGIQSISAADAHLIAAAPELYEALETARDYVATALHEERQKFAGYEHASDIAGIESDLADIDAALAKARGDANG